MDTLSSTLYRNNSASAILEKCSMEAGFRGNVTRLKYITDEQLDLEACLLASENGGEEGPGDNLKDDKKCRTSLADLKSITDGKNITKGNNLVCITKDRGDRISDDNNCCPIASDNNNYCTSEGSSCYRAASYNFTTNDDNYRVTKNDNPVGITKDNDGRIARDNYRYFITGDNNNSCISEGPIESLYGTTRDNNYYGIVIAGKDNFNRPTKDGSCGINEDNNINFTNKDDNYRVNTKDNDYRVGITKDNGYRFTENNTYRNNYNYIAERDNFHRPKSEDERVNITEGTIQKLMGSKKYDEKLNISVERCQKLDDLNKVLDKIYIGEPCQSDRTNFTDKNNISSQSSGSNNKRNKLDFEDISSNNFTGLKKTTDKSYISNVDRSQKLADSRKALDRINVGEICQNSSHKLNENCYRELKISTFNNKESNSHKLSGNHNAVLKICPSSKYEDNFRKTVDLNSKENTSQARAVAEIHKIRNKSMDDKNIDHWRLNPKVNPLKTTQILDSVKNRGEGELKIVDRNRPGCCCRKMKTDLDFPCASSRHRGKSCCHPATKSVSDKNISNERASEDSAKMFFVERELCKFRAKRSDQALVHQRSHSMDESCVGSEVPAGLRKGFTNNSGDNNNRSCRSLSAFISSHYESNSDLNDRNKNRNESVIGIELNAENEIAMERAFPERPRSLFFSGEEDERSPVPSYRNRRDYTDSRANSSEETLLWRTFDTTSSSSNTSSVPSSLTESPDSPTPIPPWMFDRFIGNEQHIRAVSLPSQDDARETHSQRPTRLFTSLRCRECVFYPDVESNANASGGVASCAQGSGQRTYTSTEAQTDSLPDYPALSFQSEVGGASQCRGGERRPRRNRGPRPTLQMNPSQRATVPLYTIDPSFWTTAMCEGLEMPPTSNEMDTHLPPPYSPVSSLEATPLPRLIHQTTRYSAPSAFRTALRMPMNDSLGLTRCEDSGPRYAVEEEIKTCCGITLTRTISFRWMILALFAIGLVCAFFGTMMTAVRGAAGVGSKEHLTLSLLLIGVGLLLVTLSGLAWRLICSNSHWAEIMGVTPTIESALPLSNNGSDANRSRFMPRLPPSYGRPHHPYAAMLYPEFQYRPPPPSYQASMQEYRLRLLLMDRQQNGHPAPALPPPPYRTTQLQHESAFRDANYYQSGHVDLSRPPSYRSRSNSCRPHFRMTTSVSSTRSRSRDRSQISLSESNAVPAAVDDFKLEPDESTEEVPPKKRESADNMVAIRQNQNTLDTDSSSASDADITGEMDILAQL